MIGQFELTVGPYRSGELRVVSFSGREAMSSLFEFDVVFLSDLEWTELHPTMFAKRATLTIHGPDGITRYVHGLVSDLEGRGGRAATGRREYRLRIVPRAALLAQRVSSRIFQDKTVREIVEAVMGNANIPHRWAALPNYPVRNYCLQYEESDLAFLERILSEHGIYYYFEHPTSVPDTEAEAAWSPLVDKLTDTVLDKATSLVTSAAGSLAGSVADGLRRELEASGDVMVFGDTPHAYRTMPVKTATEFAFALEFAKFEAMTAAERALSAGAESVGGLTGKALGMGVSALADVAAVPLSPTPSLSLLPEGGREHSESVTTFAVSRRLRPNSVELSDFAYSNPMHNRSAKSTADTSSAPGGIEGKLATYAVGKVESGLDKAGAAVAEATGVNLGLPNPLADFWGGDPPIPVYRHRARYQESDATKPFAGIMLDQLRVDSTCAEGTGTCRRMAAGYRFVLAEDDLSAGLSGDYVVTSIEHRGVVPEFAQDALELLSANYTNRFTCVLTDVVVRPSLRSQPLQQVIESAMVVGTSHAEGSLCVDELGRIKVQFHWDRDGKRDHHSSCWIRVSQPWAGRGWGFQFIPRVGMEVLVGFLGGDADRPVVLGSAYNATHPVPFGLPGSATVSGIRTRSTDTLGGETDHVLGHNELSFDDGLGNERVYLRAEKRFDELVGTDHTRSVGDAETIHVGKSQHIDVGEERIDIVRGRAVYTTEGDHTRNLRSNERVVIAGNLEEVVGGTADIRVDDWSLVAKGSHRTQVDDSCSLRVGKDEGVDGPQGFWSVQVAGVSSLASTDRLSLTSRRTIMLECIDPKDSSKRSSITMTPGRILFRADEIVARANKEVQLVGQGPYLKLGADAEMGAQVLKLVTGGGTVLLDQAAVHVGGPKVYLGSDSEPMVTQPFDEPREMRPFKKAFLKHDGKPFAEVDFVVEAPGFRHKGVTTEKGVVECEIPASAVTAVVTLWPDVYPTGSRVVWNVEIVELPPVSDVRGACMRLANLRYYKGPEVQEVTPEFAEALRSFQSAQGVKVTGELDGDTQGKLAEFDL